MYNLPQRGCVLVTAVPKSRLHGLVLIEVMVAAAISLILLVTLLTIYVNSERTSALQASIYQAQDQARIAINLLHNEIHRAGNIGCAKLTTDFPLITYPPYSITPQNKLASQNEHELTVRYAEYPAAVLLETMFNSSLLYVSKNKNFTPGEILLIADCLHAELFKVQTISFSHNSWRIVPTRPLHDRYHANAEVSRLLINHYFVASTHHKTQALYLQDITGRRLELVEGIKSLRVRYQHNGINLEWELEHAPDNKIWHDYTAT